MNKTKRIQVRITPDHRAYLEREAAQRGLSMSEVVCALIKKTMTERVSEGLSTSGRKSP